MSDTSEPGPFDLISRDGRALHYIAAAAGVSVGTVLAAKQTNKWPAQHRPRTGLRRALGLDQTTADTPPDLVARGRPARVVVGKGHRRARSCRQDSAQAVRKGGQS